MVKPKLTQRNIQIRKDQDAFLKDQKLSFNFSKFVRAQLDMYIEFKKKITKEVDLYEK